MHCLLCMLLAVDQCLRRWLLFHIYLVFYPALGGSAAQNRTSLLELGKAASVSLKDCQLLYPEQK